MIFDELCEKFKRARAEADEFEIIAKPIYLTREEKQILSFALTKKPNNVIKEFYGIEIL